MKHQLSSSQQKQESAREQEHQVRSSSAKEFGSVEDMLRFDAAQTTVPDRVGQRLQDSLSRIEPPKVWWRRWLGL
jgi:hypothetical protein